MLEFSAQMAEHQESLGLLYTGENPANSLLWDQPPWIKVFGVARRPKGNWRHYRSDGCQLGMIYPGIDAPGVPMQKGQHWVANFDLSGMAFRCRKAAALVDATHDHRPVKGSMKIDTGRWASVASFSGRDTAQQGAVYAECLRRALKLNAGPGKTVRDVMLDSLARGDHNELRGAIPSLAWKEEVRRRRGVVASTSPPSLPTPEPKKHQRMPIYLISTRLLALNEEAEQELLSKQDKLPEFRPYSKEETTSEEKARRLKMEASRETADKEWRNRADKKDWDQVKAPMSVYFHSGEKVSEDPRRTKEYRQKVLDYLHFGDDWKTHRAYLTEADVIAAREVLGRKAGGFWYEGTPRTTVRNVLHDTIPTGPPVRTPPHNLKGEQASWVDEKLEEEVRRGQLVRGGSAWGSSPFPTKEFAQHKKARKRRLVVDYRRVNARTLRSMYLVRKSSDVLCEAAGSVWMTLLDAVTGFNHILNTRRAMEMLALLWRTGQFLPVCLTFGPHNGPDDFCYVVDRVYAPGSRSQRRFCSEWLAYVDDLTIRTGRVVSGVHMTDEEYRSRIDDSLERMRRRQETGVTQQSLDFQGIGV
jgi:hypothetical protein